MLRKQTCNSIVVGIASHEIKVFEKGACTRIPRRMRVAEGSPKKKESKQTLKSVRKNPQKVAKKEGTLGENSSNK